MRVWKCFKPPDSSPGYKLEKWGPTFLASISPISPVSFPSATLIPLLSLIYCSAFFSPLCDPCLFSCSAYCFLSHLLLCCLPLSCKLATLELEHGLCLNSGWSLHALQWGLVQNHSAVIIPIVPSVFQFPSHNSPLIYRKILVQLTPLTISAKRTSRIHRCESRNNENTLI